MQNTAQLKLDTAGIIFIHSYKNKFDNSLSTMLLMNQFFKTQKIQTKVEDPLHKQNYRKLPGNDHVLKIFTLKQYRTTAFYKDKTHN